MVDLDNYSMGGKMKHYTYNDRFLDYNVIVTGAANGIGQTCAIRFALEGANVFACDIDGKGLKKTEEGATKNKGAVECHIFDITDKKAVDDAIGLIIAKTNKIHVLVNSAGIAGERAFTEVSQEEWLRYMNI